MEIGGATKLKNQGPRDPNLAFNNFRALKSDFGSDIRFCQPTRFPSSQSHASKRKNEMMMRNTPGQVARNHVRAVTEIGR
jgi:hypothetical protein